MLAQSPSSGFRRSPRSGGSGLAAAEEKEPLPLLGARAVLRKCGCVFGPLVCLEAGERRRTELSGVDRALVTVPPCLRAWQPYQRDLRLSAELRTGSVPHCAYCVLRAF